MGGFTLPQVAIAAILGGKRRDERARRHDRRARLAPARAAASSSPQGDCEDAVKKLIGGDPPRRPACSP